MPSVRKRRPVLLFPPWSCKPMRNPQRSDKNRLQCVSTSCYKVLYNMYYGHFKRGLRVKLILPALTEATSPYWRPIKYSLFPPLGLATLAAFLTPDREALLAGEHVQRLDLDDRPDLVLIQVYITNAHRAYRIAD